MKRFPLLLLAALSVALPAVPAGAQPKPPAANGNAKPDAPKDAKPDAPKDAKPDASKDAKPDAKSPVFVEVMILHATNSKKGIDQRIGDMPELKKPPFSSYDSYELNGRVLQTKLLDILPKDYFRISASINKPGGKTFLPLLEVKAHLGQAFMVAGQSYKRGILVLVIRATR
jgi:hypothetical protein